LHTGLRRGELLALKWTDVDLETGKLFVQRSLAADGTFNPPKRKSSQRTVRVTAGAVDALKKHKASQNEERLRVGSLWEDHTLIFPNQRGKPMHGGNLYHRDWKNLLSRAGLPHTFTFHSLRHTFATTLLRQNVNPKIVQEALGHATITQTMDTYSHVMPDMQDAVTAALENALS
jgi:integrase